MCKYDSVSQIHSAYFECLACWMVIRVARAVALSGFQERVWECSANLLPLGSSACLCRVNECTFKDVYALFFVSAIHTYSARSIDCILKMHSKSAVDIYWMETSTRGQWIFYIFCFPQCVFNPHLPISNLRNTTINKGEVGCWLRGCQKSEFCLLVGLRNQWNVQCWGRQSLLITNEKSLSGRI